MPIHRFQSCFQSRAFRVKPRNRSRVVRQDIRITLDNKEQHWQSGSLPPSGITSAKSRGSFVLHAVLSAVLLLLYAIPVAARPADALTITDWILTEPDGDVRRIDSTRDDTLYYERGYASYESRVRIPRAPGGVPLAFFTEWIDDADRCYLNGVLIGSTGAIPPSLDKADRDNFRAASRRPRLYVVPDSLIRYDAENLIRIEVFNYSGYGGFGRKCKTKIGAVDGLLPDYNMRTAANDAPRLISIGVLFILFLFHLDKIGSLRNVRLSSLARYTAEMLFPFMKSNRAGTDTNVIIAFKLITNMIVIATMSFFVLSEITFKYHFIKDEIFWFKAPAFAYLAGFAAFLTMNFGELFSRTSFNVNGGPVLKALFILAHPLIYIPPLIYILLAPAWLSWGVMVNYAIYWMIALLLVFMAASMFLLVRLFIFDPTVNFRVETKVSEIALRLFCIFITMSSLTCFKFRISPFDELVTVLFGLAFSLYATASLNFYVRYRQEIAFGQKDMSMELLAKRYGLSKTESYIALLVKRGHSRKEIIDRTGVSDNTLKGHLRRIYSRTLQSESSSASRETSNNKLHQLMVFLNKKE